MTVRDALLHFPRDYRDFSGAHSIADFVEGEHSSVGGTVSDVATRTTFAGRSMLTVTVDATGGRVRGVWFSMPFMAKRFEQGMRVVLAGQPRRGRGGWEFAHPEVRWLSSDEAAHASEWLAISPRAEGVQPAQVRIAVQGALDHAAGMSTRNCSCFSWRCGCTAAGRSGPTRPPPSLWMPGSMPESGPGFRLNSQPPSGGSVARSRRISHSESR